MTLLDHVVLQVDDLKAIGDWYDQIVSLAGGTRTFDMPNLIGYALPGQPAQLFFSLATGWSWLVMAWAMLPGLMNLTRMSASGGMEIGYRQQTANSRVRCPGIKKSGLCNATADFTDEPARD